MAGTREITDMMGRMLTVPEMPCRIVSLVPSQTELLHHLGLDEEVVGITKFCVHPESWFRSKPRVGGTKQVHYDRVAALQPDLIIANKEENVRGQIEVLEAIAPVWVSDITNLEEALEMIGSIGQLVRKESAAAMLAEEIRTGFQSLQSAVTQTVAYGIWRDPWMWAGGDTFIHDLLRRIGWVNVLSDVRRYPEVSLEALEKLQPGLVLLSSEPYPFKEKHIDEIKSALPQAEVQLVDGEMFSWYGSHLVRAVAYFQSLLQSA